MTGSCFDRWKSITAALVPEPKSPSTPPRGPNPAFTSASWSATTRAPRSPYCAKPVVDVEVEPPLEPPEPDPPEPEPPLPDEPPEPAPVTGFGLASAFAVASSTTPVAGSPCDVWNVFSAAAVAGPKIPSAPPRSATPALINACCNSFTATPDVPDRSPTIGDELEPPEPEPPEPEPPEPEPPDPEPPVGTGLPEASALAVASSTLPDGASPTACWYVFSAVCVAAPKMPSTPPRTGTPAFTSVCCRSTTLSPRDPICRPSRGEVAPVLPPPEPPDPPEPDPPEPDDAVASAVAVASSTEPVAFRPAARWKALTAFAVNTP